MSWKHLVRCFAIGQAALVALKLCELIDIHWVAVLMPILFVPFSVAVIGALVLLWWVCLGTIACVATSFCVLCSLKNGWSYSGASRFETYAVNQHMDIASYDLRLHNTLIRRENLLDQCRSTPDYYGPENCN